MTRSGRFITLEGGDGAGKSTQAALLAERLRQSGREVVLTREPGGTKGAERIRSLILAGSIDRWSPVTELLLFSAARRDHCERTILPALARGAVVISDRFHDSTAIYQFAAHGASLELFDQIHRRAIGLVPHRTLVLLLDPAETEARLAARGDGDTRFERRGPAFHRQVDQAYRALCRRESDRCRKVDGSGPREQVAAAVWAAVREDLAEPPA